VWAHLLDAILHERALRLASLRRRSHWLPAAEHGGRAQAARAHNDVRGGAESQAEGGDAHAL
jgi:hypothetical protein